MMNQASHHDTVSIAGQELGLNSVLLRVFD